jgi:hypothetical protein
MDLGRRLFTVVTSLFVHVEIVIIYTDLLSNKNISRNYLLGSLLLQRVSLQLLYWPEYEFYL